nr:protein FAR1-related sequence 5-like [Tanacetum cinerariifolium]
YGYKFVPFTGIDHNQRCVTFGAALLSDETTESFSWMLEAFLITHKKQPPFAVTDQDGALRNAFVKMFPDSHHRLYMWHITEKLPGKIYSHEGNMLVQFMLCFESAIEKQRYTQRVLDNASNGSTLTILTELPFEKHACDVYTPSVFKEVVLNKMDCSVTCSCGHYNQHGFLCRRVFCVFRIYGIHKIPNVYLNRRWTKNVLSTHLLDKRHRYGPCIEETDTLASQVHQTIEECIGLFRNDTDKLSELLSTIQDLKKKLENKMQILHVELNKDALYSNLLDVTVHEKVVIKTPKSIFRSKGTRRIKSAAEKSKARTIARTNSKVPFKRRTCSVCGLKGHNKAAFKGCSACGEQGHHKGICNKFPNQDKGRGRGKNVVVDDEDEGDTDDNDTDKLSELLSTVQDLKKKLENEMQIPHVEQNKDALYSDLLDVTVPDKVVIKTPKSIFISKGTMRIKSAAEKSKAKTIARTKRKVPFKRRTCSVCGLKGHNKATCRGRGKNVVVDDEDEGDTDDQFDDEALGATEDEFDEDDE